MTTRNLWIGALFLTAACAADAPDAPGLRSRGAVLEGSCSPEACGGQSQDGCWCDEACAFYGDCCQDAGDVCGVDECADDTDCADGEVCSDGEPRLCVADEPAMCGGIAAIPCEGEGVFCDVAGHCGAGDQSGVCRPIPEFCTQQYDPVCGCDGKTYGNACAAHQAGVSVAHDGPCPPKVCGGIAGTPCQPGDFCDYGSQCGAGGQTGTCAPRPEVCTQEYAPVCGCDGKTYANLCLAHAAAVSVAHLGPCDPPTDTCKGLCGGPSEDASCWCDDLCAFWGDCCADKQDFCG